MTTDKVSFFEEFDPPTATAQGRRHIDGRRSYLPARQKKAAAVLQAVFERHAPARPLSGALAVTLVWTFRANVDDVAPKTTKPDLDNLLKLAFDAATRAGIWTDDRTVTDLRTAKFNGPVAGLAFNAEPIRKDRP